MFWKKDKIKAPTTPSDAASVAVAIPVYIDPITDVINIITGQMQNFEVVYTPTGVVID